MRKGRPFSWLTLWVVEMWMPASERWEPTTGTALTKREAVVVCGEWREVDPDDRFRVVPYVRVCPK